MNTPIHLASVILAVLLASEPAGAQALERMRMESVKPLLKRAIEQGSAHGVLVGEGAVLIRQKFDTRTPIEIDVRAIQALSEPGCSRVEVTTRQVGVREKGIREDKSLTYQLNYCQDGRMPTGS